MLEIKIVCNCGAKYKFEVEPINGRMPAPVQCPVCQADGTAEGNRLIGEMLARGAAAPAVRVPSIAIPSSSMPKPAVSVRLGASAPGPVQAPPAPASAPYNAPSMADPPLPSTGLQSPHSVGVPPVASTSAPARSSAKASNKDNVGNVTRGYIGAAVGGLIGMAIWYGIIVITNYEVGLIAWGVGGLTGIVAVVFAGGTDKSIGVATAICAMVAIIGGEFLATKHMADKMIASLVGQDYEEQMANAKEAVQAKTDDQIKTFLAKTDSDEDSKVEASSINADRIVDFKKKELPEYRKMAEGKLSRKEYEQSKLDEVKALIPFSVVLKQSIGLFTILWIFLGVGTAYRIGAGE
jgi:hypothetical protein